MQDTASGKLPQTVAMEMLFTQALRLALAVCLPPSHLLRVRARTSSAAQLLRGQHQTSPLGMAGGRHRLSRRLCAWEKEREGGREGGEGGRERERESVSERRER